MSGGPATVALARTQLYLKSDCSNKGAMLNRVSADLLGVLQSAQAADKDQRPGLRAALMGDAAKRPVINAALWFGDS